MLDLTMQDLWDAGVEDLDDLVPFLSPGLMNLYAPFEAGPMDEQGIPWWFPLGVNEETGDPLTPEDRLRWFQTIFNEMYQGELTFMMNQMSDEEMLAEALVEEQKGAVSLGKDLAPSGQSQTRNSVPVSLESVRNKRKLLAHLHTLLLIRYYLDNGCLPTLDQL